MTLTPSWGIYRRAGPSSNAPKRSTPDSYRPSDGCQTTSSPSSSKTSSSRTQHETPPPLSIPRVCRRWRAVALANPRVWTKISFDAERMRASPCGAEMIARSRGLPTYLFVRNVDYAGFMAMKQSGVLAGFRDTCKGLELSYGGVHRRNLEQWDELDDWLAQHLPNLESLSLLQCRFVLVCRCIYPSPGYTFNNADIGAPDRAPDPYRVLSRLLDLHIELAEVSDEVLDLFVHEDGDEEGRSLVEFHLVFPFHFPNLQRLILDYTAEDGLLLLNIIEFSTDFPNLEELYLSSRRFALARIARTELSPADEGTAWFPHLRVLSLGVEWNHIAHFVQTFHALMLPSLSELAFGFTHRTQGEGEETQAVEAFLWRSQCPLKKMHINDALQRGDAWIPEWVIRLRETYPGLRVTNGGSRHDYDEIKKAWYY